MNYSGNSQVAAGQELTRKGYGSLELVLAAISPKSELPKEKKGQVARLALVVYTNKRKEIHAQLGTFES